MRKYGVVIMALLTGFSASAANADGLKINPGLWETKTITTNNMMGTSSTKSVQECIRSNEFDPVEDIQNDVCTTEKSMSGNTMNYEIICNLHGRAIEGNGVVTVEGDTMTDNRLILNGVPGGVSIKSESRRIGEC
ncbi:MAG TPA: DUF3617 family protein [Chromatiales bacterium]|nr:DUF3617 family protein [Thiotrichales bacterium]HIP69355.1 DUF3617 family protein [Chromatiales bacterium]